MSIVSPGREHGEIAKIRETHGKSVRLDRSVLPVIPNDSAFSKGSCRPNLSLLRYNQLSAIQEERVHGGFLLTSD